MPEENLIKDEVLSPEGVEEKLLEFQLYQVTLTGGGKFRTYYEHRCNKCEEVHRTSTGVHDTLEEAKKHVATQMNMQSAMVLNPLKVFGFLFEQITGRKPPKLDDD